MAKPRQKLSETSQLFDAAVSLNPGEHFEIPCADKKQLNSIRTMLYRQKKKFAEVFPQEAELLTFESRGNILILKKRAEAFLASVIVVKANGTSQPFFSAFPQYSPAKEESQLGKISFQTPPGFDADRFQAMLTYLTADQLRFLSGALEDNLSEEEIYIHLEAGKPAISMNLLEAEKEED